MNLDNSNLKIIESKNLYKWASVFNRLQRNFFEEETKLRREKQIEDFILLNGFTRVKIIKDTDVFSDIENSIQRVEHSKQADLVVITDQKFSRYPCPEIINRIRYYLENCSSMYVCLNRHYINIDNSYIDKDLDSNFCLAITQWLKKSLPEFTIVDLSLNYLDIGESFTWAIPDRHYYITI